MTDIIAEGWNLPYFVEAAMNIAKGINRRANRKYGLVFSIEGNISDAWDIR